MRFVFTRKFYLLFGLGLLPLSLIFAVPSMPYFVLAYDVLLVAVAILDYFKSRNLPEQITIERTFAARFAIGSESRVTLNISNATPEQYYLKIKDEFPAEMSLRGSREADIDLEAQSAAEFTYDLIPNRRGSYAFGKTAVRFLSQFGLVWCQTNLGTEQVVKVYPNMHRAREIELRALGAR
jgi:uncharacterized protein (DUF58 family)